MTYDWYQIINQDDFEASGLVSKELSLTLTERQGIAMCGVPWHTSEGYIEKLVEKGYRVDPAGRKNGPQARPGPGSGGGCPRRRHITFARRPVGIGAPSLSRAGAAPARQQRNLMTPQVPLGEMRRLLQLRHHASMLSVL